MTKEAAELMNRLRSGEVRFIVDMQNAAQFATIIGSKDGATATAKLENSMLQNLTSEKLKMVIANFEAPVVVSKKEFQVINEKLNALEPVTVPSYELEQTLEQTQDVFASDDAELF